MRPTDIVYREEWANYPGGAHVRMLLTRDYSREVTIGSGQIYRLRGS